MFFNFFSFLHVAAETPFQGGCFKMKLVFGPDFPSAPPKGYMASYIYIYIYIYILFFLLKFSSKKKSVTSTKRVGYTIPLGVYQPT